MLARRRGGTLAAAEVAHASVVGRYACGRELNASGTTPHFHIDVNRAYVPNAPALLRPRREVVAHGNGRALAGGAPDAQQLGPRRNATAASIGPRCSVRRLVDQVVRIPIDRGRDTALL